MGKDFWPSGDGGLLGHRLGEKGVASRVLVPWSGV